MFIITLHVNFFFLVSRNIKRQIQIIQETLGSIKDIILSNNQNRFLQDYLNYDKETRKKLALSKKLKVISYGYSIKSDVSFYNSMKDFIIIKYQNKKYKLFLKDQKKTNILNLLCCFAGEYYVIFFIS